MASTFTESARPESIAGQAVSHIWRFVFGVVGWDLFLRNTAGNSLSKSARTIPFAEPVAGAWTA